MIIRSNSQIKRNGRDEKKKSRQHNQRREWMTMVASADGKNRAATNDPIGIARIRDTHSLRGIEREREMMRENGKT